jgi:hypothetical protein
MTMFKDGVKGDNRTLFSNVSNAFENFAARGARIGSGTGSEGDAVLIANGLQVVGVAVYDRPLSPEERAHLEFLMHPGGDLDSGCYGAGANDHFLPASILFHLCKCVDRIA